VIDIGAFELQPPSANFDDDGDIDGTDFLAWQRGFSKASNVMKEDGDADNDGDVDDDDLGFWEAQFGQPVPTIAAASSAVESSADEPSPLESAVVIAQPLVRQIVSRRGSDSNWAPLLRANRFEVVDRALDTPSPDKVRDGFDSLVHAQRDSIRTIEHHAERGIHIQATDDFFATLDENIFSLVPTLLRGKAMVTV